MIPSRFGLCAASSLPSWWRTREWGPPRGQFIICWGIVVARNNGLSSFITDYWMFSTIAISYILSKFKPFFYLGPQLIILTLQVFNASLEFLHLSGILLLFPFHLLTPMEELNFKCQMHRIVQHCDCFR